MYTTQPRAHSNLPTEPRAAGKPAILALSMPVIVGFTFRVIGSYTNKPLLGLETVAGFMMFGSITGLMMAIFLDNSGGAWDNAKKLVEKSGEKGTPQHAV
eukprot:1320204-Amorphochlora_amoeboformis.AAC.1